MIAQGSARRLLFYIKQSGRKSEVQIMNVFFAGAEGAGKTTIIESLYQVR